MVAMAMMAVSPSKQAQYSKNGLPFVAVELNNQYDSAGCHAQSHLAQSHLVISPIHVYTTCIYEVIPVTTAKVFRSGNSQAVRLPKEFRFKAKEVEVFRRGDEVVLREKPANLARAFDLLASLPDDFDLPGRANEKPQKRKGL
jgi:antitoxin VapB